MFDVEVDGTAYRESEHEEAGDELVLSATADGVELGLSVCYDVRFPELYRVLAVRGARILLVPAAFTLATTREHWATLVRARAIENQALRRRRQPDRRARARASLRRALDDRGPVGRRAGHGARLGDRHHRRPRPRPRRTRIRARCPSLANRRPAAYAGRRRLPDGRTQRSAGGREAPR